MDKTNRTEIQRLFLTDGLPEPLTRASSHIQIFDNYIANTRIRLRSIRDPEKGNWSHVLQQRFPTRAGDLSSIKYAELYLDRDEYERFKIFEGAEIRKNRYFHEFDGRQVAFNVYLGGLWGVNIAKVEFRDLSSAADYEPPRFALFEVTAEGFFDDGSLVSKKFEDVQAAVERLEPLTKGIGDSSVD